MTIKTTSSLPGCGLPGAAPTRRALRDSVVVLLATVLTFVALGVIHVHGAEAAGAGGVRVLGGVRSPRGLGGSSKTLALLGVTPDGRYLIAFVGNSATEERLWGGRVGLVKYDLSTPVPKQVQIGAIQGDVSSPFSGYFASFDSKRNLLYVLRPSPQDETPEGQFESFAEAGVVHVVDLDRLEEVDQYHIGIDMERGFIPQGVSYSAADDRVYLVGQWSGTSGPRQFAGADVLAGVIAIDPGSAEGGTARVVWRKVVPQCPSVLANFFNGAPVRRSQIEPALYFGCSPRNGVGAAGVARVWTNQDRVDYYPISGDYGAGIAVFDHQTDRFYMRSDSSSTPGAWAFDGLRSAWVGQVGTPSKRDAMGYSQHLGHLYLGSSGDGNIVITDGRATPIPQGQVFDLSLSSGLLVTDPGSRRLFMPVGDLTEYGFADETETDPTLTGNAGLVVVEDLTPVSVPPNSIDPDSLTADVPEGPNTAESHAGTVSGFGALAAGVGGYGSVVAACKESPGASDDDCETPQGVVSPADRALYLARVAALDMRNSGAAAASQSAALDTTTDAETSTYRNILAARPSDSACRIDQQTDTECAGGGDPQKAGTDDEECPETGSSASGNVAMLEHKCYADYDNRNTDDSRDINLGETQRSAAAQTAWPWRGVACLDFSDERIEDSSSAGDSTSSVLCDRGKSLAQAETTADPWHLNNGEGLRIGFGDASFVTTSHKDALLGTVTEATSTVHGLRLRIKGFGSLRIGAIEASARTFAHGRPGTNGAGWERTFEDVVLRDGAGDVLLSCQVVKDGLQAQATEVGVDPEAAVAGVEDELQGNDDLAILPARSVDTPGACSPDRVIRQINSLFESQVRFRLPEAEMTVTPKGAYAGVSKPEADHQTDLSTNNLNSLAVPAIEATVFNDGNEKSRLVVQFAAIQASAQYGISLLPQFVPPPPTPPEGTVTTLIQNVEVPVPGATPSTLEGSIPQRLLDGLLVLVRSPGEAALVALIGLTFAGAVSAVRRRLLMVQRLA
ncbi:MAG TPA: hypothetical protein VGB83_08595 [Actinomycetota bacterium]